MSTYNHVFRQQDVKLFIFKTHIATATDFDFEHDTFSERKQGTGLTSSTNVMTVVTGRLTFKVLVGSPDIQTLLTIASTQIGGVLTGSFTAIKITPDGDEVKRIATVTDGTLSQTDIEFEDNNPQRVFKLEGSYMMPVTE